MNDIINIHSHFNTGSKFDAKSSVIARNDFDFLKKDFQNCNITKVAFSTFSSVLSDKEIFEQNNFLSNFVNKVDWAYQWIVLDPRQKKLYQQIEEKISCEKVLGIKIHSIGHKYDILKFADEIFSFANNLHTFVLMHPDNILKVAKLTDKYPNMNLIIAHLGSIEHIEAIKNSKNGNVFTDTSGMASFSNNIIEYAVEQVGSEKIFFGTDTYSSAFQRGRIDFAQITEKDKENIFLNNAKKHFRI